MTSTTTRRPGPTRTTSTVGMTATPVAEPVARPSARPAARRATGTTLRPKPKPKPKAEPKAKAKAEPDTKVKPATGTKTKPKSKPRTKPRTKTSKTRRPAAPVRETRPVSVPAPQPGLRRRPEAPVPVAAPRAPFVLLVVGLLGGALVSLLLLNTVLAEDAFTLTDLQRSNKLLSQQKQALQEEIAREESPERLAQKAKSLGMVQPGTPSFVDAPTGRILGQGGRAVPHAPDAAAGAIGVVGAPGAVVTGDQLPGWGRPAAGSSAAHTTTGSRGPAAPTAAPARSRTQGDSAGGHQTAGAPSGGPR